MIYETKLRSFLKACSWRLAGSLVTALLVFLFTHRLELALGVGALEAAGKIAFFFIHERFWDRLPLGRRRVPSAVIWFTGLSGSGKSTIAAAVTAELERRGLKAQHLDGDALRGLLPKIGFSKAERDEHVRRTGVLASMLEKNGVVVLASLISPYRESRDFVRGLCRNFIEVHVATPLAVCERRDTKKLYARARRGELRGLTGVDDPYEPPSAPDISLDTSSVPIAESVRLVLERFDRLSDRTSA